MYCAMIMTHTWKVVLLILKWALNVKSLCIGTSLLTKPTNLWLNRLTDGWCNAAARTTLKLAGELVLPQANNCINSGGLSKASTRKVIKATVVLVADFFAIFFFIFLFRQTI